MRREQGLLPIYLAIAGIVGMAISSAAFTYAPQPETMPRCASDDWNSTHVDRCYIERVTDGAVIVLDKHDKVISTNPDEADVTMKECGTSPDGPTIPDVCVTDDGDVVPDQG